MRYGRLSSCLSLLALLVTSCSEKQLLNENQLASSATQSTMTDNGKLVGYANMGGEVQEIEYTVDGEFAVFDEHVRIPLSQVAPNREFALGLVTDKTAVLWPGGVVPYSLEGGFPQAIMNEAVNQYQRAGIKFVPRTNQNEYLVVRMIDPADPTCPYKCDFAGIANSFGYVTASQKKKMTFPNYHAGNMILVINGPTFPQLVVPPNYNPQSSDMTPEAWRKYGINTTLHEIGHALGLRHEQAHSDAKKNIVPLSGKNRDFETDKDRQDVTRFDLNSVMLYCDYFKSRGTRGKKPICDVTNMPTALSNFDVSGLKNLYSKVMK